MSNDRDDPMWPPALFGDQLKEMSEQAVEQQTEFLRQMMTGGSGGMSGLSQLDAMSRSMATFKTRIQSGGRISIPDAEREALDIQEGDIVQTVVIPIKRESDSE